MSAATVVDPMALLKALAAVPSDAGALQLQQLAHQARALLEHGDTLGVLLHHHEYGDSLIYQRARACRSRYRACRSAAVSALPRRGRPRGGAMTAQVWLRMLSFATRSCSS